MTKGKSKIVENLDVSIKCFYGCGQAAKYLVGKSNKPQCETHYSKCPAKSTSINERKRKHLKDFLPQLTSKFPDYTYTDYSDGNVTFVCPDHGAQTQDINSFLRSINGCRKCYDAKREISYDEFVTRATEKHKDNFVYHYKKDFKFQSNDSIITITCKEHGSFEANPFQHIRALNGCCPGCYGHGTLESNIHKLKSKFPQFEYISLVAGNLTFKCSDHGTQSKPIKQFLDSVNGCSSCAGFGRTLEEAKTILEGKNFDLEYLSIDKNYLTFKCEKHGVFTRGFHKVLTSTTGCPRCVNNGQSSKVEKEWLDSLNIDGLEFQKSILGKLVDGYDPKTNTIYEFHGDFFHGNPDVFDGNDINPLLKKTYGELFDATNERTKLLESNGYTVIEMWERNYVQS